MTCGRCGAKDCIIIPNVAPDFKSLQGVGLTQHTMLCPDVCAGRWSCGACENDGLTRTDQHATWCEIEHPEVRAEWERKNERLRRGRDEGAGSGADPMTKQADSERDEYEARRKSGPGRRERRSAAQAASVDVVPHVHVGMTCGRCGAKDCIIIPNVAPDFKSLQGVGLTQHTMLCPDVCAGRWSCGACENDGLTRTDQHATWCEIEHPEVRAEWERKNDRATLKLAAMVAARGEFLPAFIMDALFPGFEHADPPSFVAFKEAAHG